MKKYLSYVLICLMIVPCLVMLAGCDKTKEYKVATFAELTSAVKKAKDGDKITLTDDINFETTLKLNKKLTINLNGKTVENTEAIWNDENDCWSLISVGEGGNVVVTGNGTMTALADDCYAFDVQYGGKLKIKNGTFNGNIHSVYVHTGELVVEGGKFIVQQQYPQADKAYEFVLNCYDASYRDSVAKITVYGGEYYMFNPANCKAEGADTNFLAEGYTTEQQGDYYKVVAVA